MLNHLHVWSAEALAISLLMGHFVGDFVLQNDRLAIEKCPGKDSTLAWQWWMLGHTSCHGLLVLFFTSSAILGLFEMTLHFLIDYLKCEGKFNLLVDQILHILCKFLWVYLYFEFIFN